MTIPTKYRFLPHGDADHALMEVYVLYPAPPGSSKQRPAHGVLVADQNWIDAPEMAALGTILDQDPGNLVRLQQGMKASKVGALRFSVYRESRIRHYHHMLGRYLQRDGVTSNGDQPATGLAETP